MSKLFDQYQAKEFYTNLYKKLTGNKKRLTHEQWLSVLNNFREINWGLTEANLSFYCSVKAVSPKAFLNQKIITQYKDFLEKIDSMTWKIVNGENLIYTIDFVDLICHVTDRDMNFIRQSLYSGFTQITGENFRLKSVFYPVDRLKKASLFILISIEKKAINQRRRNRVSKDFTTVK